MTQKTTVFIFAAIMIGALPKYIEAADAMGEPLPASVQETHRKLSSQLSPKQTKALVAIFPDFRLLKLCAGRFSGGDGDELVLGIWKPMASDKRWKRDVHRVGLIRSGSRWSVHVIDDELEKDKDISRSFPMSWQYAVIEKGFVADMRCGVELGKDPDIGVLDDKPFFDLNEKGLLNNSPVCFSTSDTYNNWDCVVYSPKDKRFRLWFQQAHAD
ncbi:MAG TPA: hypothetical protein DEB40_02635 [Elusimicrobia bacterium]|nr:hypothetical protein [Elusimicrobiota bacterium]HBT60627.1 hypothetical protein [Elusimicrobiota bacterium]